MTLQQHTDLFFNYLQSNYPQTQPQTLYQPMQYILELGGKRIRPVLTLLSAEGLGAQPEKALAAALAVEVFHNFTLLHDDIMDKAPIRRGQLTVHEKWNTNTAILSGDVMMIKAYEFLNEYEPIVFKALTQLLTKTAIEVCEGQQYDMDFETRTDVSLPEYMEMIRLKTSVLLGAALQMGSIIAQADTENQKKIYDFGILMGLAFQLQDDYLDTFGDVKTFGKQIGGDIMEGKKTWLVLKTLELATPDDQNALLQLLSADDTGKIQEVQTLFRKYRVNVSIQEEIYQYGLQARNLLETLDFKPEPRTELLNLLKQLENRTN